MSYHAARMRRWLLLSAPAVLACGLRWHAGGAAAALGLWLLIGARIPRPIPPPYCRSRKTGAHRLFFSFSVGAALLCVLFPFGSVFPSGSALWLAGAVGFSLFCAHGALFSSLPPRAAWPLGAGLCLLAAAALLAG